jgi:hypothetical protein
MLTMAQQQQEQQVTSVTNTMLYEEYTESSETLVSEDYGGGGGLNRQSSWRKFKNTVKGWVGSGQTSQPETPDVPSAVFPTTEVNLATTCVNTVMYNTNCYSGAGGGGITTLLAAGGGGGAGGGVISGSPPQDVPRIVVTFEEKPRRPARRTESLRIRPSVSAPDFSGVNEVRPVSVVIPQQAAGPPPISIPIAARPMQQHDDVDLNYSVGSLPETTSDDTEMQKRMAVLKIRQAMKNMKSAQGISTLMPNSNVVVRRHSDINTAEVDVAASSSRQRQQQQAAAAAAAAPTEDDRQQNHLRRKSTSNASMKKQKAKPMIWDHFEMLPHTTQHARCKTCKMNVSCKFNTGNFVRHLQLAHKDVYRQYQNKVETAWTRSNLERSLK